MKKLLISLIALLVSNLVLAQSDSQNYIQTTTYKIKTTDGIIDENGNAISSDNKIENITYFDGFGKPKQNIAKQGGGNKQDIIIPILYDNTGRQAMEYLPYADPNQTEATSNLDYREQQVLFDEDNVLIGELNNYYINKYPSDISISSPNPFSKKVYEPSPLNRVLEQAAPGSDWSLDNGHTIKYEYSNNLANEVKMFAAKHINNNRMLTELEYNGFYAANMLYKSIVKDENWQPGQTYEKDHTVEEYKDKLGRVVLTRAYDGAIGSHDTYYVYDDYGNLTYVLPPLTFDQASITQQVLDDICYQYKYDHKSRLVEKKIPGKGWEYIVYDKLDRPVMTQDELMREDDKWLFAKFDAIGRPVYSGLVVNRDSRTVVQDAVSNFSILFEQRTTSINTIGGTEIYYTNNVFPNTDGLEILTVNYYDDYEIGTQITFNPANGAGVWEGMTASTNVKGLPTVSRVKVLGTKDWIISSIYYDDDGRAWETHEKNEYLKTDDWVLNKLDFAGKVLKSYSFHVKDGVFTSTDDVFTYDHMDRLLTQTQKIANENTELIVSNEYDEVGQLVKKNVGNELSNPLQEIDLSYNVRGWLKEINNVENLGSDLFSFKVNYNQQEGAVQYDDLYNGNISQTIWKTASIDPITNVSEEKRAYSYDYDALNRIKKGTSRKGENLDVYTRYHLRKVNYDKNGNITELHRDGKLNIVDELSYSYENGNQLFNVTDAISAFDGEGFEDRNVNNTFDPHNNDYSYDSNGNMTSDKNKDIVDIKYNHLDLPVQVSFSTGSKISYVYDANGTKLQKTVQEAENPMITKTIYVGKFQYQSVTEISSTNDNYLLTFINQPEGYIEPEVDPSDPQKIVGYSYTFQYVDHLGNIRLSYQDIDENGSIDPATEIKEENNYYPFGLKQQGYNNQIVGPENKYKFGGEEFEDDLGKNTVAYQWRDYDPAIARFNKVDRYAEKYFDQTPYHFTKNNPIRFVEMNGDSIWFTHEVIENEIVFTMHFRGKVYNTSDSNVDMTKYANDLSKKLANAFSNSDVRTDIQIEAVTSLKDVKESDHLQVIVDEIEPDTEDNTIGVAYLYHKISYVVALGTWSTDIESMVETGLHELGHNFGLEHSWEDGFSDSNNASNPMNRKSIKRDYFSESQIFRMQFTVKYRQNSGKPTQKATETTNNWLWNTSSNLLPYDFNVKKGDIIPTIVKE